jgi:signal transduction histidine kinase
VRARLLGIVLSLVVLVVLGLGIPLALTLADGEGERLFADRLGDTERFASLAQLPLTDRSTGTGTLNGQLARYAQVYGVQVAVLDVNGRIVFSTGDGLDLTAPAVRGPVDQALAGTQPTDPPALRPWTTGPYAVAAPVLVNGELTGAVVTVSDPAEARGLILGWWAIIAAAAVVAIALALAAALPVVRWVLRPVKRLNDATAALSGDVVEGREVHPIVGRGGPRELRRLSEAFDAMADKVGEALGTERQFVADASHQLRGPIGVLGLRLESLAEDVGPAAAEHFEAVVVEQRRLRSLVDQLLELHQTSRAEPEPVDVDRVVLAGLGRAQEQAGPRGIVVALHGEPGGRALAPAAGLAVVLEALLDNAVKYTRPDTVIDVTVRREDRADGDWVVLTVRDHGPGLSPEDLDRATDRFWRGSAHSNLPGSGLGLAIVARQVRTVGAFRLELPEDGGLLARVELPGISP